MRPFTGGGLRPRSWRRTGRGVWSRRRAAGGSGLAWRGCLRAQSAGAGAHAGRYDRPERAGYAAGAVSGEARCAALVAAAVEDRSRAAAGGVRGAAGRAAREGHGRGLGAGQRAALRHRHARRHGVEFRRRMRPRRPRSAAVACALTALLLGGCSSGRPHGAAREGLYEDVAGLDYNVFITRELNLRDAEDRDYYRGPEAPPGFALYGVFIQVCNHGHGYKRPDTTFTIEDNQGNRFHPLPLPSDD